MTKASTTARYQPSVDRYSQQILDEARRLAADETLSPPQRRRCVLALQAKLEDRLETDHDAGRISRQQFDGGTHHLGAVGGELQEIRAAAKLAVEILAEPSAAAKLAKTPLLFTSDVFHNTTLTADTTDGRMVHMRFGTHGGLELRDRAPDADGFPFAGSKWVEGEVVVGDKVLSFVDMYTDNFKVDLGDDGRPVALRFAGEVDVKALSADILTSGKEKWTAGRPATEPRGRAILELSIPLQAAGGETKKYGVFNVGYFDKNFALTGKLGSITITPLDAPGAKETIQLAGSAGALEEGQFRNVPKALPAAYSFAQGQRIDTSKVLAQALADAPADLAPLFGEGTALRAQLDAVIAGGEPHPALAGMLDRNLVARARLDPALRRLAAPALIKHLGARVLPESSKRTTSTQFEARLLADNFAAKLVNQVLGRAIDAAGIQDPDGTFHSYEPHFADILRKNADHVDPVAVLSNNHVPLWRQTSKGMVQSMLERRTELLFDEKAGAFLLGFQEVFHE